MLILLRGPPSSGKTTIAKQVVSRIRQTHPCALVHIDDMLFEVLGKPHATSEDAYVLVMDMVRSCIDRGFNVVVEGITSDGSKCALKSVLDEFDSYSIFLDIDFDIVLDRHRHKCASRRWVFSQDDVALWYTSEQSLSLPDEVVINTTGRSIQSVSDECFNLVQPMLL